MKESIHLNRDECFFDVRIFRSSFIGILFTPASPNPSQSHLG
jgi:hypothetical protein